MDSYTALPSYSNAFVGGVTLREHFKLVGPYTTLPSIGNPVMIVTSCRVIYISQVDR